MSDQNRAALDALLAHELRSPIAAILGYHELLADGALGSIDDRARDAIDRIASAARQLRSLADGFDALAAMPAPPPHDELLITDPAPIARRAVQDAGEEAALRGTSVDLVVRDPKPLRTHPQRLRRILELVLAAAISATPGGRLAAHLESAGDDLLFSITGASLDPAALDPPADGASLRIAMAQRLAASLEGAVSVADGRILVRFRGLGGSD